MINYSSQNNFYLEHPERVSKWIKSVCDTHEKQLGEIEYVFCSDEYLLDINREFLNHDTYTDIITFDYSLGNEVGGEIYISTDRVEENAKAYDVDFQQELRRVIIHGVLHLCGFEDSTEETKLEMRQLEDKALAMY